MTIDMLIDSGIDQSVNVQALFKLWAGHQRSTGTHTVEKYTHVRSQDILKAIIPAKY